MNNMQKNSKYKTEMCKNWIETGHCNYGAKCRFAHGKNELMNKVSQNDKYKSKLCFSFHKNSYCPYGNRCLFIHDERTLD
jgi:hypothetical protein